MRKNINELNNQNWLNQIISEREAEQQELTNAENEINRVLIHMVKSMNKAGELPQEFKQMLLKRADIAINNGSLNLGPQIKKALA